MCRHETHLPVGRGLFYPPGHSRGDADKSKRKRDRESTYESDKRLTDSSNLLNRSFALEQCSSWQHDCSQSRIFCRESFHPFAMFRGLVVDGWLHCVRYRFSTHKFAWCFLKNGDIPPCVVKVEVAGGGVRGERVVGDGGEGAWVFEEEFEVLGRVVEDAGAVASAFAEDKGLTVLGRVVEDSDMLELVHVGC